MSKFIQHSYKTKKTLYIFLAFSVLVNGFTADLALKKSDERLRKQASCVKIKIEQQKIIDEINDINQHDNDDEDDYTAHIREIAEKTKTRFKNVTMNANFKH